MSEQQPYLRSRPFKVLVMVLLLLIVALIWQNRVALNAFPGIISAYTAKEYCSCRYVMGNPAEYCRGYVKQYVPASLVDDADNKRVSAEGLGQSATAVWRGARQGCVLQSAAL